MDDVGWFAQLFLGSLAAFCALERVFVRLQWFRDATGRFFALHVLCNLYVTIVHLPDVLLTYLDPLRACAAVTNVDGTAVVAALHAYHMLFHRPLAAVDWVHHVVMICAMLPLAVALNPGRLLGHGAWFSSGFPGGVDYALLVLVKTERMASLTEKRLNASIQTWLRAPGCLAHALFTWIYWRSDVAGARARALLPSWAVVPAMLVVVVTFYWNALFFQSRVVANYAEKAAEERKNRGGA